MEIKISSTTDRFGNTKIGMPDKLSSLRQKLNLKALKEPKFRFYQGTGISVSSGE